MTMLLWLLLLWSLLSILPAAGVLVYAWMSVR